MAKFDTRFLIKGSFARLFAILTFGAFGGAQGAFSASGEVTRFEFLRDYLLPAFYLFILNSGIYRLICYLYGLFSLSFTSRRIIFAAMLAPAIFTLFVGEIKRLRNIGLWIIFALANFYLPYGMLACGVICVLVPRIKLRS